MAGEQSKEKGIFTKHYASLCNTITDINILLPFFVQEEIITTSGLAEIDAGVTTCEKVKKLLLHISGPLEGGNGNTTGFYKMLTIMAEHGNHGTKDLAKKMSSEVTASVQNKGLFLCCSFVLTKYRIAGMFGGVNVW